MSEFSGGCRQERRGHQQGRGEAAAHRAGELGRAIGLEPRAQGGRSAHSGRAGRPDVNYLWNPRRNPD